MAVNSRQRQNNGKKRMIDNNVRIAGRIVLIVSFVLSLIPNIITAIYVNYIDDPGMFSGPGITEETSDVIPNSINDSSGSYNGYIPDLYSNNDIIAAINEKANYKILNLKSMMTSDFKGADFVIADNYMIRSRISRDSNFSIDSSNIGVSPIVILAWEDVSTVLEAKGIVLKTTGDIYSINMLEMIELMKSGLISLRSSNPAESGAGFTYAQLLAISLLNDINPTAGSVARLSQDTDRIYSRLLKDSRSDSKTDAELFRDFLEKKIDIVALPEKYIAEYLVTNLNNKEKIRQNIRILYPTTTLVQEISINYINPNLKTAISDFLYDYKIRDRQWDEKGIRSSVYDPDYRMTADQKYIGLKPSLQDALDLDMNFVEELWSMILKIEESD